LGEGRIEQELIGRRAPMRLREVRMAPPVTQRVLVTGRDDWLDFRKKSWSPVEDRGGQES
jgi:hypothetical protein